MKRSLVLLAVSLAITSVSAQSPSKAKEVSPPSAYVEVPARVAKLIIPILDAQVRATHRDTAAETEVGKRLALLAGSSTRDSDEAVVILMCFYVGESQEEIDAVIRRGKKMYPLLRKYRDRTPRIPGRSYPSLLSPDDLKKEHFDAATDAIRHGRTSTADDPQG